MSRYLVGTDVLGAEGQYITIKVNNIAELVRREGGLSGGLAYGLAPQTLTNKVYSEMIKKMISGFKDQGVNADVSLSTTPGTPRSVPDIAVGALVGAGAVGIGYGLFRLLRHLRG